MHKPIVIVPEDVHGPWHLAKLCMYALKQDGQHLASAKIGHEMERLKEWNQLTDEEVITVVEMFVTLATEDSAVAAKTRVQSKMPKVDLVKAGELAIEYKTDTEKAVVVIEKMAVANTTQYKAAVSVIADVISQAKEIDAKRREFVDPLNGVVKNINAFFKPPLERLDYCEDMLKKMLANFVDSEAKKRSQLLLKSGEADNENLSEKLIEQAEVHLPPKVSGVSMVTTWKGEVSDADKIPREYLIPDVKVLKALTKAKAADPGIPGWKAWPSTSPSITVDKVKS